MTEKQNDPQKQINIELKGQYIKDLSFENLGAPEMLVGEDPNIDISIKVGGRHFKKKIYESTLHIKATAKKNEQIAFVVEITYAGLYEVDNPEKIDENKIEKFLYTNSPQLLFPFVRRIIADATRDGNMPPLLLSPPDFEKMYQEEKNSENIKKKN